MAEAQQLDPWRSSYLQLKSMSVMLSDIHRKICLSSEVEPRSDGIRPEAHAEPIHEANSKFRPTLENQDARVFNSSLADPNRTFKGQGIFMEFESREDQLKMVHEEASENPGASIEELTQDSLEESIRRLKDLKGIAWIKEFVRLEKLGKADEVLRCVIDNELKEEVVKESVPYTDLERESSDRSKFVTDSEQEPISRSNCAEKIEDRVKHVAACKVLDEMSNKRNEEPVPCTENLDPNLERSTSDSSIEESFITGTDFNRGNPKCFNKIEIEHLKFWSELIVKHHMGDFKPTATSFLVTPYAQQVFDIMPARGFHASDHIIRLENACLLMGSPDLIFDPGGTDQLKLLNSSLGVRIGGIEQAVSCQSREMLLLVRIPDVVALAEFLSGLRDFLGLHSSNFLGIPVAHKVLVERTSYVWLERESVVMSQAVDSSSNFDVIMNKNRLWAGNLVFDPGVPSIKLSMWSTSVLVWFAKGNLNSVSSLEVGLRCMIVFSAFFKSIRSTSSFVFDPGKFFEMLAVLIKLHGEFDGSTFVFDPGIVFKKDGRSTWSCRCVILPSVVHDTDIESTAAVMNSMDEWLKLIAEFEDTSGGHVLISVCKSGNCHLL